MKNYLIQFFTWAHLPQAMQPTSQKFGELAAWINQNLPDNPEKTVAMRKLLEAKDCAVRAMIYQEPPR